MVNCQLGALALGSCRILRGLVHLILTGDFKAKFISSRSCRSILGIIYSPPFSMSRIQSVFASVVTQPREGK